MNYKNKKVIFYDHGTFIPLAERLAEDFGEVLYFSPYNSSFPSSTSTFVGSGLPGVKRINNFFDYVDDATFDDTLFVFPDVGDGDLQVHLRNIGKRVFGSGKGESMELQRDKMKEYMKSIKLDVGKYRVIKGLSKLRDYLKENDNKWVKINIFRGDFETFHAKNYSMIAEVLDDLAVRLGPKSEVTNFIVEDNLDDTVEAGMDLYSVDGQFPSKCIAGIEIKNAAYVAAFKDYADFPTCLTSFNDAIAPALENFKYRSFFSTEQRVNKQKSYMNDFCFSDDTEILTDSGWKFIKDIVVGDFVATMNISTREIEYQEPTDFIINDYNGKLLELTNKKKSIECLITPNHLVLRTDRNKTRLFKEQADSLTDKGYIPRTGIWKGNNEKYFILPEYHKEWTWNKINQRYFNRKTKEVVTIDKEPYDICTKVKHEKALKIKMGDWAEFLGWYLSEGSTSTSNSDIKYTTQISQTKFPEKIKEVLNKLPFKYKYDGKGFRISSVQLSSYLKDFGLCNEKFVPDYIKTANSKIIRKFLDAFNWGDGSRHKGNKVYFTTSKRLSDDLQELIFKVGSVANIIFKQVKGTIAKINGKEYIRKHNSYTLYEHNTFTDFWFETGYRKNRYIKEVNYFGKVYCVTVPNGTLYVRRKGKPFWSSNCARLGSPPSELYIIMYKNISHIMWKAAEGVLVDPEVEQKFGAELLIKSVHADTNWMEVRFPDKIKPYVKLRNCCVINGKYYMVPRKGEIHEIGAIVASGNTLQEAIDAVKGYAKEVEGYWIEIDPDSLDRAIEESKKLEEYGIKLF